VRAKLLFEEIPRGGEMRLPSSRTLSLIRSPGVPCFFNPFNLCPFFTVLNYLTFLTFFDFLSSRAALALPCPVLSCPVLPLTRTSVACQGTRSSSPTTQPTANLARSLTPHVHVQPPRRGPATHAKAIRSTFAPFALARPGPYAPTRQIQSHFWPLVFPPLLLPAY